MQGYVIQKAVEKSFENHGTFQEVERIIPRSDGKQSQNGLLKNKAKSKSSLRPRAIKAIKVIKATTAIKATMAIKATTAIKTIKAIVISKTSKTIEAT